MTNIETLTLQLFARWGLEEMRKPDGQRRDRDDIYSDAYMCAMDLLGCRGFDDNDADRIDDEFGFALFTALLAELVDEEKPVAKALEAIRDYFNPEKAPGFVPRPSSVNWGLTSREDE